MVRLMDEDERETKRKELLETIEGYADQLDKISDELNELFKDSAPISLLLMEAIDAATDYISDAEDALRKVL